MSGLLFPSDASDSSDDSAEEYDEEAMAGPEALLFKHFSGLWVGTPFEGALHKGAKRETCTVCGGAGWLWVLPSPPSRPEKGR